MIPLIYANQDLYSLYSLHIPDRTWNAYRRKTTEITPPPTSTAYVHPKLQIFYDSSVSQFLEETWAQRKSGALHPSHESMLVTYRQRQALAATSRSLLKLLRDNKASAVPSLLEKRHYCCLVPRPHYSARPTRFGSRGPSEGPLQGPLVT